MKQNSVRKRSGVKARFRCQVLAEFSSAFHSRRRQNTGLDWICNPHCAPRSVCSDLAPVSNARLPRTNSVDPSRRGFLTNAQPIAISPEEFSTADQRKSRKKAEGTRVNRPTYRRHDPQIQERGRKTVLPRSRTELSNRGARCSEKKLVGQSRLRALRCFFGRDPLAMDCYQPALFVGPLVEHRLQGPNLAISA
jgi:hypothetical protein